MGEPFTMKLTTLVILLSIAFVWSRKSVDRRSGARNTHTNPPQNNPDTQEMLVAFSDKNWTSKPLLGTLELAYPAVLDSYERDQLASANLISGCDQYMRRRASGCPYQSHRRRRTDTEKARRYKQCKACPGCKVAAMQTNECWHLFTGIGGATGTKSKYPVPHTSFRLNTYKAPDCTQPTTVGYDFSNAGDGKWWPFPNNNGYWNPAGVICEAPYSGIVEYQQCSSAGTPYSVSGCTVVTTTTTSTTTTLQQPCTQPSTDGYNFDGASGTTTINDFSPKGVTCADGYFGEVVYTKCPSGGTDYSVSGCTYVLIPRTITNP